MRSYREQGKKPQQKSIEEIEINLYAEYKATDGTYGNGDRKFAIGPSQDRHAFWGTGQPPSPPPPDKAVS